MSKTTNGAASLAEAISKIESVGQSKSQELKDILEKDYHEVRKALDELKPRLKEIQAKVEHEATEAKHKVEKQVQEHPWYAMAIVGFIGFFLGWLIGHGRRD